jgi:hypothetical protein
MDRTIDVHGPRYRNIENTKNSVLPSFAAQSTRRTQQDFTEKVTLHVYTASNRERQKKQNR